MITGTTTRDLQDSCISEGSRFVKVMIVYRSSCEPSTKRSLGRAETGKTTTCTHDSNPLFHFSYSSLLLDRYHLFTENAGSLVEYKVK